MVGGVFGGAFWNGAYAAKGTGVEAEEAAEVAMQSAVEEESGSFASAGAEAEDGGAGLVPRAGEGEAPTKKGV